jgi:tetratricopeptide (TPR) repeat protein
LAMFKKTIALEPRHADAYYNLGVIYKNRGDIDKAIAMFEEVMRIAPQADALEQLRALKALP